MKAIVTIWKASTDETVAELKKRGFQPNAEGPLPAGSEDLCGVAGEIPIERWFDVKNHHGTVDLSVDIRDFKKS